MLNAGRSKPLTGVVTLRTLSAITIEERGSKVSPLVPCMADVSRCGGVTSDSIVIDSTKKAIL